MKFIVAALLVSLAACEFVDMTYDEYLTKYNKMYGGREYGVRRSLFESRVADIKRHNARSGITYTRSINHLTDVSDVELTQMFGLNKNGHFARAAMQKPSPLTPRLRQQFSDSIDWVAANATTKVKNQGGCGSCWAFAGTESIESCGFLTSGKLLTLAPQEFVDCVPNPNQCGGSGGCEGATPDLLFEYAKSAGAVLESVYPYQASDNRCRITGKPIAVKVGGYVDVTNNDYNALMDAVQSRPVTVGVAASEWFSYDSGVFSFDDCGADVNHAVLLVGYGTDSRHGTYWKVQNSWGGNWGENGFIRLQRQSNDTTNCQDDTSPLDGFGCKGGPSSVNICGTCGVLYGASYPTDCQVL